MAITNEELVLKYRRAFKQHALTEKEARQHLVDLGITDSQEQQDALYDYKPQTIEFTDKEDITWILWQADPDCKHELDPKSWSGIKCLHCSGWFCY